MRKRYMLTLLLLICLSFALTGENFYESYSETERLMIADAYLAVSENYQSRGESNKAESFRSIALEVYPEIEAARQMGKLNIRDGGIAKPARPAADPERPAGTEPSAVRYYFSKLMRGIFTENSRTVMSLLSTRLYLPGYEQGVSRDEVEAYLNQAFEKYPLNKTDPSLIYNFNRYFVKKEGTAWTVKINLTPEGIDIMKEELGFPGESHLFYFREYREGWRLIAINGE